MALSRRYSPFQPTFLETLGLIGQFWQFVGMQGLLGICLSALALYFLARALGASEIASGTAALFVPSSTQSLCGGGL